jgi:hypothetical protein
MAAALRADGFPSHAVIGDITRKADATTSSKKLSRPSARFISWSTMPAFRAMAS